ncbi:MAG: DMT family transporter [Alphaproteobacteria bacterium]|jgi:drug/metabolite transporter (DMT)-like permease|nr:DMT family transporter [Alphaproteobacteria bacterium]
MVDLRHTFRSPNAAAATGLIGLSSICFGVVPLFARHLLDEGLTAEVIAIYRFGLSALIVLPFMRLNRHKLRQALLLFATGLVMGLGWSSYIRAIEVAPLASAGIIYMTYPLFAVIFARLLLGQRLTTRALMAVSLVLGAAVIALSPSAPEPDQFGALLRSLPAPVTFALIVVVLAALTSRLHVLERVGCGMAGAVAGLLPSVLAADNTVLVPGSAGTWALIAGMVVVTATGPQLLYVFAAPKVGTSRAAVAGALELPTMIAVGWLAFAEAIGPADFVAAILIAAAVATAPPIVRTAPNSASNALAAGARRRRRAFKALGRNAPSLRRGHRAAA